MDKNSYTSIIAIIVVITHLAVSNVSAENSAKEKIFLIFIGNSITEGAWLTNPQKDAAPVRTAQYLQKKLKKRTVLYSNQGVSGCTTVDYLPRTQTLFPKACAAANKLINKEKGEIIFSIMLGTNDSAVKGTNGSPVSTENYKGNLKTIIDKLLLQFPDSKVVLHRPTWYSPNTYNGAIYLQEGLNRLNDYFPKIKELISYYSSIYPNRVYLGDTDAYAYFEKNFIKNMKPEKGNAGTFYLHPNIKGAKNLGKFWAKAILKCI